MSSISATTPLVPFLDLPFPETQTEISPPPVPPESLVNVLPAEIKLEPVEIKIEKTPSITSPSSTLASNTPPPKLEDFELGYSPLGVATVASAAFAIMSLIPSNMQSFVGCTALGITGGFWAKEALSTTPNKEFSLAAKQLTLASLLFLPLGFYILTMSQNLTNR